MIVELMIFVGIVVFAVIANLVALGYLAGRERGAKDILEAIDSIVKEAARKEKRDEENK